MWIACTARAEVDRVCRTAPAQASPPAIFPVSSHCTASYLQTRTALSEVELRPFLSRRCIGIILYFLYRTVRVKPRFHTGRHGGHLDELGSTLMEVEAAGDYLMLHWA
ncbi:hypothetical protein NDU88_001723 [Pleurodeles waltl]|uniref:Uncharacterized protein n=1 Tax=Pleurodeles waltl TaxID=8319 RepID=A0AAV7UVI2_PLEWA|nr:hypothetical protein NDU88_001723 [Pleurodeles waltl]